MSRLIIIIIFTGSALFAFDPAYHIYLGSQTFDVWQDFDPDFYEQLAGPNPNTEARRFYYIGLTLPDMFNYQDGIANLIDKLYDLRDEIEAIFDKVPLIIQDVTKNNVQARVIFNDPPPNYNLQKLWEMANWTREHQSEPCHRALVYGTLMHVIQDLFAHQVLQPSRFGHGFAVASDSMNAYYDPLMLVEFYHELFTPTYIQNWDFIKDRLFRARIWLGGDFYTDANPGVGYFDFQPIYNLAGQRIEGWQDRNFDDVQTFVDAANAKNYSIQNLTRERLEAYIHGWSLMMFLLYGYRKGGGDYGGVLAHPNWTFSQIFNYYWDMGDDYFRVSQVPNLCALFQTFGAEGLEYWFGAALFDLGVDDILQEWTDKIIEAYLGSHPWPWYFENPEGIDLVYWNAIPLEYKTDSLEHLYHIVRREIEYWSNYASIMKPNLRTSYYREHPDAVAFKPMIKATLDNGYSYYDYDDWNLSRKAGLSGGIHSIPDAYYRRQPGISKMRFQDGSTPIFAPMSIAIEGPAKYIDLNYKVVTFGPTILEIWGKNEGGGGTPSLLNSQNLSGPQICIGCLSINAQSAVNQGYREISFVVKTKNIEIPDLYSVMLDSDYRDAYNSHFAIYNNQYYQSVFKNGDPTRTASENPIDNPIFWWPYVLSVYPAPAAPSNLIIIEQFDPNSIILQWQDNSSIEAGFKIARKVDDGEWNENYKTVGANTTQCPDTVSFLQKYSYKVRAYDDQGYYSDWSNIVEFTSGVLVQSDYSKMSAYNNGSKVVIHGNCVYIAFVKNKGNYGGAEKVCCLRSTDGGLTFIENELWTAGQPYWSGLIDYPSLTLDNNGTPHVVWGDIANRTYDCYRKYYYSKFEEDNWTTPVSIYGRVLPGENPDSTYLSPPSFVIKGDSGFVTFRENFSGDYEGLNLIRFALSNPAGRVIETIRPGQYGFPPAIDFVQNGSAVLAYPDYEYEGELFLIYRYVNDSWLEDPLSLAEYAGVPSICSKYDIAYITYHHQYNNDSVALATLHLGGGGE
ncbi:hypothetical protein AMJ52_04550, partial [candidate division TA06 bacterium DG_78]